MSNYLKKLGLTGMVTLAGSMYTGGSLNNNQEYHTQIYNEFESSRLEKILEEKREKLFDQRIEEQSSDEIKTPNYKLAPNSCSKYARLAANKIFHKKYNPGHAWDLKYDNTIIHEFKENEISNDSTIYQNLKDLIIDGTLRPGMMVVAKRDMKPKEYKRYKSYGTPGKDERGNKIEDTHVILYLGINDKEQPEFLHQWINQKEKITIDDFKERKNLKPTYILDEPGNHLVQSEIKKDNPMKIGKAESQYQNSYENTLTQNWAKLATKNLL